MENLESLVKKFVYTGVGFISLSAERFKTSIEDLVKDNKLSESEGKKIISDFFKDSEGTKKDYAETTKDLVKKVTEKLKFVRTEELQKLTKRLSELEKAVADKIRKEEE
jgi:polyhydroxyalkanoate synthesis regulator phasin